MIDVLHSAGILLHVARLLEFEIDATPNAVIADKPVQIDAKALRKHRRVHPAD